MSDSVTIKAESASEFREKQKHAEALGLSLKDARFGGNWESDDGEPVFLNGSRNEIEKVGHKYFHIPLSTPNGTEIVPCEPARGGSINDAGYVRAEFTD